MGIRGLTTFINNRSHLYLDNYELHDCNVVIDGNSIASQLYKWHCKSNDCFGGDYDKFGNVIYSFFDLLSTCKITPYIIFDGGYEQRKLATVISRMKNKIRAAEQLNSVTEGCVSVFPLFLRETFLDIVLSLNIKTARCEFEGDTDIASVAKVLNCPLLSYDSDFYIFDALYIPFSTFEMSARIGKQKETKESYKYVSCKIYRIDRFLKSFGGLDKSKLPILAVLLGNDYVKRSVFSSFFKNIKIHKCRGIQNDQQNKIKSVIVWLQNETIFSAIRKVLSRYKINKRKVIMQKIQTAIKGYYCMNSETLSFLGLSSTNFVSQLPSVKIEYLERTVEENIEDDQSESEEVSSSSEDDIDLGLDVPRNAPIDLPQIFLEKYKQCLYPACFMDILTQNRYYCVPQVEKGDLAHSHTISLEILAALHKILTTDKDKTLSCFARNNSATVQKFQLPYFEKTVPSLFDIQEMDVDKQKSVLHDILGLSDNFVQILNHFPPSWHLFLISINYVANKQEFDILIIYAVILCYIVLNYVDRKVGFYRSTKTFVKKFGNEINNIVQNKIQINEGALNDTCLDNISHEESLLCLMILIPYFQMDAKMKTNIKLYDKDLVHSMTQLQSCLLHVRYLNSLLNFPYSNLCIHNIFDGTFIYNMVKNFRKRANIESYFDIFLKDCPSILHCLKFVVGKIKTCFGDRVKTCEKSKRKRKKKQIKQIASEEVLESCDEGEAIFDPNNKFSLLSQE